MATVFIFGRFASNSAYRDVCSAVSAAGHRVFRGQTYDTLGLTHSTGGPLHGHSRSEIAAYRRLGFDPYSTDRAFSPSRDVCAAIMARMEAFVAVRTTRDLDFIGSANDLEWISAQVAAERTGSPRLFYVGGGASERLELAFARLAQCVARADQLGVQQLTKMMAAALPGR